MGYGDYRTGTGGQANDGGFSNPNNYNNDNSDNGSDNDAIQKIVSDQWEISKYGDTLANIELAKEKAAAAAAAANTYTPSAGYDVALSGLTESQPGDLSAANDALTDAYGGTINRLIAEFKLAGENMDPIAKTMTTIGGAIMPGAGLISFIGKGAEAFNNTFGYYPEEMTNEELDAIFDGSGSGNDRETNIENFANEYAQVGGTSTGDTTMGYESGTTASQTAASYQQQALDYLMERDEIPRELSESALQTLGGVYGLEGGTGSQQDLIDQALSSPLYGALMGGQEAGEESILRNASMTGGLRSGDIQSNLYDYNTQLQNSSLLSAYNQELSGLSSLAGLEGYGTQIADQTSAIGETLAAGQTAAAQAEADEDQAEIDKWLGIGSLGIDLIDTVFFCDRRLKKNIKKVGQVKGHPWYTWDWNVVANKMGLIGSSQGVIADEVYQVDPKAIKMNKGFMMVDYHRLGIFKEEA